MELDDDESINRDNEKNSYQQEIYNSQDNNNFNPAKFNESPYDSKFFQFFGMNEPNNDTPFDNQAGQNERDYLSHLFYKNKIFPGLSGWVTLDQPKAPEKSELDLIDLNYMREENNDNIDFHLQKFFEEDNKQFKISPPQNPINVNPNIRKAAVPTGLTRNKKGSNTGLKSNLPSFFENMEDSIHEFIENSCLNSFCEFTKNSDLSSNLENYFFIEQQQENSDGINYAFSKHFHNNYSKFLERLKTYYDNKKLDAKLMLQIMSSFSINILSDLIKFIKLCDKSFCFDVLKSKNQGKLPNFLPQSNIENIGFYNNNNNNNINNNSINIEEPSFTLNPLNTGKMENESLFSVESSKKNRKGWSVSETEILEKIIRNYIPHQIPSEIVEDFSKKMNRSIYSIQAKIQKMKKILQKQNEQRFTKDEEIKIEGVNGDYFIDERTDVSEKNDFLSASHENSTNFGTSIISNLGKRSMNQASKGSNKYDISLENMIKITLKDFPMNMASKSEILTKMEDLFFSKNNKSDSKWRMSTSQLLASCKSFKKKKGTYGINERNITKETLNLINTSTNKNELNMKMKLIMILNKMTNKRASTNEITDFYLKYFKEKDNGIDTKRIKASIQKVLIQYSEFDTSQSKTCYMLSGEN